MNPGARVGPYRLVAPLGQGAMGSVFRARHERLGVEHALKLLEGGPDAQRAARFEREARALAQVRSPHVVAVHQAGVEGGRPWVAMDLVEGEPLAEVLARGRPSPGRALELLLGVARGVAALHAVGVVHRDLKPQNVVVRRDGTPVVIDLGVALLGGEAERLTRSGALVGTLGYMAPEQVTGKREAQGPATDVCALGLLLFEVATGQPPYDLEGRGLTEAIATVASRGPPAPSSVDPRVPRAVDAVVARATAREPGERYLDAAALADALEALLEGGGAPPARPVAAWVALAAGISALVLTAGVAVAARRAAGAAPAGPSAADPAAPTAAAPPAPEVGAEEALAAVEAALAPWRIAGGAWVRERLPALGAAAEAAAAPLARAPRERPEVRGALALTRATQALGRAAVAGRSGTRAEALAALDEAEVVLAEGDLAGAWRDLVALEAARLAFDRGRFSRARALARTVGAGGAGSAAAGGPGRPALEARFLGALVALWLNERADRGAPLQEVADLEPEGPTGLKARAAAARYRYDIRDAVARAAAAVAASRRAVEADPADVDAATTLSYALLDWAFHARMAQAGFARTADAWVSEAVDGLRAVVTRVPDHPRAVLGLSAALLERGEADEALTLGVRVVALLGVEVPQDDIADHVRSLVAGDPARRRALEERSAHLPPAERAWLAAAAARPSPPR